jgi:hypothetical protein
MPGEDAVGVVIYFDLPLADHPGPLQAEIEAADSREQRPEGEWLPFHALNIRAMSSSEMPLTTVSKVCSELADHRIGRQQCQRVGPWHDLNART